MVAARRHRARHRDPRAERDRRAPARRRGRAAGGSARRRRPRRRASVGRQGRRAGRRPAATWMTVGHPRPTAPRVGRRSTSAWGRRALVPTSGAGHERPSAPGITENVAPSSVSAQVFRRRRATFAGEFRPRLRDARAVGEAAGGRAGRGDQRAPDRAPAQHPERSAAGRDGRRRARALPRRAPPRVQPATPARDARRGHPRARRRVRGGALPGTLFTTGDANTAEDDRPRPSPPPRGARDRHCGRLKRSVIVVPPAAPRSEKRRSCSSMQRLCTVTREGRTITTLDADTCASKVTRASDGAFRNW